MAENNLTTRLAEARRSLSGEERLAKVEQAADKTKERRAEAIRAMEGSERRQAREQTEQAVAEQAKKLQEEVAAAKAAEEQKTAEAERVSRLKQEAEEARLSKINQSATEISQLKKTPTDLPPIRTLKSDLTNAAKEEKISLARIALASEEKSRNLEQGKTTGRHRSLFFLVTILFLVAVGGGLYFFGLSYLSSPTDNGAAVTPGPRHQSLIFAEKYKALEISGQGYRELKRQLDEEIGGLVGTNEVLDLYFTQGGKVAPFRFWQEALNLGRSENFLSAFVPQFMFGIYGRETPTAFLVLQTTSYDRAFASLLAWEKTLPADLVPILTGSTRIIPTNLKFEDRIYKNTDTRLVTLDGQELLVYSFVNRDLLIIATRLEVLGEAIERYRQAGQ